MAPVVAAEVVSPPTGEIQGGGAIPQVVEGVGGPGIPDIRVSPVPILIEMGGRWKDFSAPSSLGGYE